MPGFGLGILEVIVILLIGGVLAGVGLLAVRIYRRLGSGGQVRELEESSREFERDVESRRRLERLPRG